MAAGPGSRAPRRAAMILGLIAGPLLAMGSGCEERDRVDRLSASAGSDLGSARVALGASFIGGRVGGLRRLLHSGVIVQPPEPDSALRGAPAADYLERLARESDLARSELTPTAISREGGFLLEQGTWFLEAGERTFRSRYTLRWRDSPGGWKVVLWRWTPFH